MDGSADYVVFSCPIGEESIRRREFIAGLGGTAVRPLATRAQQPSKAPRIGFLTTGSLESSDAMVMFDAFRQALYERGYVEGKNTVIEVRAADSKVERFPTLATELVQLRVDLIVATNSLSARAVKQATSAIPTVVPIMGDPGDGRNVVRARADGELAEEKAKRGRGCREVPGRVA